MKRYLPFIALLILGCSQPHKKEKAAESQSSFYDEKFRPQIHFSPRAHWMNDPNGMVKLGDTWHLFYQYYPEKSVWGPMHWGHATSSDLFHWKHEPVALAPDSLGYIFSGSAVIDSGNTTGFGRNGQPPMVAIFTHHNPEGEKAGKTDYQNQSLAYSLDSGKTFIKYAGNPVLRSPGIKDFRDPKVMWYAPQKKWVMTLATTDRITFYSSPDLKKWVKESEFGAKLGEHGGVWECPDLFPLSVDGKTVWVLIVNINPGGPVGGSGTQYFTGDFDGRAFRPFKNSSKWLDVGPDDYAGVTFSNTPGRRVFMGWMSNWLYAEKVPTTPWRSANTLPRELSIIALNGDYYLKAMPVKELAKLASATATETAVKAVPPAGTDLFKDQKKEAPYQLNIRAKTGIDFTIILSNAKGQRCEVGYDHYRNNFFTDRRFSGATSFHKDFPRVFQVTRTSAKPEINLTLVVDRSSVELFADDGLNVMTTTFFPADPYNKISLKNSGTVDVIKFTKLTSAWKKDR